MIQNNIVEFNEEEHTYTVNGKPAISVTTLLQSVGITEDMTKLPKHIQPIIEQARQRGIHYDRLATEAMEEMQYEENEWDLDEWQQRFIKEIQQFGAETPQSQLRLGIDSPIVVAGSPDILEEIDLQQDGKQYVGFVGDLKATYNIKIPDVTWQTNIYSYLRDPENHENYLHFVVHYDEKVDRFTTRQLKTIPNEKIEKVFLAYQLGENFSEQFDELVEIKKIDDVMDRYNQKLEELEEIKKEVQKLEETLVEKMEENFIDLGETEKYTIKFTRPTTKTITSWAKIASKRNEKRIEEVNKILEEMEKPILEFDTNETVKKNATQEEIKDNTSTSQVAGSVKIIRKE